MSVNAESFIDKDRHYPIGYKKIIEKGIFKMKRGLSFVLSIVMLAILLAACGNSGTKDEQSTQSAEGGDSEKSLRMALVLPEK